MKIIKEIWSGNLKVLLFSVIIIVLTFWFPDYSFNDNSVSRALPVISLAEEGKLYFDKYELMTGDKSIINNHVYSDKAPLPVFLVYPFVELSQLITIMPHEINDKLRFVLMLGGYITSSLPLILIMIYLFAKVDSSVPSGKNYWLVTLPFMSSFIWIYNATFYSHILAGFLLCLIYFSFEKKNYLQAGMLAGFLFLTEYPVIVIPAVWLIQYAFTIRQFKLIIDFILGFIPLLLLLLVYNYVLSGDLFTVGYSHVTENYSQMKTNFGFGFPSIQAIWGMTFSTYRGLLFFAPLLFPIIIAALIKYFRNNSTVSKILIHPWLMPFIIYIIFISGYYMWWGGWSFGPRHLIPIVLFIFFLEAQNDTLKKYFALLFIIGIAGVIFVLIVKSTIMYNFPSGLNPFTEVLRSAIKDKVSNSMNILTIFYNIAPVVSSAAWFLIYILSGILIEKIRLK